MAAGGQVLFSACFNLLEVSDEQYLYLQHKYLWLQLYIFMNISQKREFVEVHCPTISQEAMHMCLPIRAIIKRVLRLVIENI